eukprot:g1649.t1
MVLAPVHLRQDCELQESLSWSVLSGELPETLPLSQNLTEAEKMHMEGSTESLEQNTVTNMLPNVQQDCSLSTTSKQSVQFEAIIIRVLMNETQNANLQTRLETASTSAQYSHRRVLKKTKESKIEQRGIRVFESNRMLPEYIVNYTYEKLEEECVRQRFSPLQELIELWNYESNPQLKNEDSSLLQEAQDLLETLNNPYPYPTRSSELDFQSTSLVSLNLNGRSLENLKDLSALDNLRTLILTFNGLETLDGLGFLPRLERLDCSHNKLHSLKGIQGMPQLRSLQLEWNQISDPEEVKRLIQNPLLNTLNFSNNPITHHMKFPEFLKFFVRRLQRLNGKDLDINNTNISIHQSGQLEEGWTEEVVKWKTRQNSMSCNSMRCLNLNDYLITNLEGIDLCLSLEELSLKDNFLSNLNYIGCLRRLRNLNVASNQLRNLEAISELVQLTYLDLSGNQVQTLRDIRHLKNLQQLYASSNRLTTLDDLWNLSTLQVMYLMDNPTLAKSLYKTSVLYHLTTLKVLDGEEISVKDRETAKQKFDGEAAQKLVHEAVRECGANDASELDLSNRELLQFPQIVQISLQSLQRLILDNNKLKEVPGSLTSLPNLTLLSLAGNSLSDNCLEVFLKDPIEDIKLTVLNLGNNKISSIEKLQLQNLRQLQSLFLNNNFISCINETHFPPKLQELILDGNYIRKIDVKAFQFSHQIRELRLEDNLLESLSFLSSLEGLSSLHLSRNRIKHVSELDHLSSMTQLVEFVIWRNPMCRKRIYREISATKCRSLIWIDDREITPQERMIANGWR